MLDPKLVSRLKKEKNLLAFSAGVDSTALFFLLLDHGVPFDLAIVNYHTRKESDEEVSYANALALEHDKELYIHDAALATQAFEEEARRTRYTFFETLIQGRGYTALLTAHQLNDQLEWFLMQLGKGAGLLELLGMQRWTQRAGYTLCRPLLEYSKKDLQEYLDQKKVHYFIDSSNADQSYRRNFIRHSFSDPFIEHFKEGLKKSFGYIQQDQEMLLGDYSVRQIQELSIIKAQKRRNQIYLIDKELKRRGYMLSSPQREEITHNPSLVVGGRYIIERREDTVYIAPVTQAVAMPKKFKESCRIAKVPSKLRAYLFSRNIGIAQL